MNNDMLTRYLYAIEGGLPNDLARADIVAEIADVIQSHIEDRASELGRPLTTDEEAEIITAYGHPRVVAASYAKAPYLIGPELMPFYSYTLRVILVLVVTVELLVGALGAAIANDRGYFFMMLGDAIRSAILIFALVTIGFAIAERSPRRIPIAGMTWDPRSLPVPGTKPVSRVGSLAAFIANTLAFLVVLDIVAVVHHFGLDTYFTFTAGWHAAYYGTLAGSAVVALASLAAFARPALTSVYEGGRALGSLMTMGGVALTLGAGPLLIPSDNGYANVTLFTTMICVLVVLGMQVAFSVAAIVRKPAVVHP
jgi:hypothetical protein